MSKYRVKIIDPEHPHHNETGVMDSEKTALSDMYAIVLDDCPLMVEGCYATQKQCKLLGKLPHDS